jgi:hypothetical protein
MSHDGDLSTEDLAQPARPRQADQREDIERLGDVEAPRGAGEAGYPVGERAPETPGPDTATADVGLLEAADEDRFRQRWSDVQARFVDDPQEAVRTADSLVAELMQSLAQSFNDHKGRLESQWQRGGDPDTEELRQALQRYRSFFNRLLST